MAGNQIPLAERPFALEGAFILGGEAFDIGTRVIKWDEKCGFNQYKTDRSVVNVEDRKTGKVTTKVIQGKRYKARVGGLASVRQFFVHHSGGDGRNPSVMYETLHNQRGLSVQFAVEDDGRIYQFLDAAECAFHAGSHNGISIGVECCLYPDAEANPDYYSGANLEKRGNLPHKTAWDVIHGKGRKVFCFTDQQAEALARLAAGCWVALGHMTRLERFQHSPEFPRTEGSIPRTVYDKHQEHVGLIGHLQCTANKWDPAGFPWERFEQRVADCFATMGSAVRR